MAKCLESSVTTQNGCSPTNCLKFCVTGFNLIHRSICLSPVSKNRYTNVSWMPDPYCIAVNAFNFSWKTHKIYAFPPFSLVGAAISKFIRDNTTGIMIIPKWTTQYWFPTMLAHLIDHPIQLPSDLKRLSLPFKPSKAHPQNLRKVFIINTLPYPRYVNIWDIYILLAYFESLPANSALTLKCLTEKLTVLLLILSEQRKQTLLAIYTDVEIY